MKPHATLLSFLFPLLAAAPGAAQEPSPAPAAKPATQAKFVLPAGEIPLEDLIDRCSAYLGRNILVSPPELHGAAPVRLQQAIETDGQGCEDLLANLLYRSNLALTVFDEQVGMLEVISMAGPRAREIMARAARRTPEEILARPSLKVPVTTVVQLEHINATIATNALRPFFASAAGQATLTLGNVGNNANILLSGMQDQVAQAIQLLRTCDVASGEQAANDPLFLRVKQLEERLAALEKRLAGTAENHTDKQGDKQKER